MACSGAGRKEEHATSDDPCGRRSVLREGIATAARRAPMTGTKRRNDSRGPLVGLLITVVLLVVGWWLARELTNASRMQDCLMSGRTNCNPIDAPAR